MNIKKIFSLILALSMLISCMVVSPAIASAADKPTLEITSEKVTEFSGDLAQYDYGSEYDAYLVTFNITGVELKTELGTGMAASKASGTSLSSYTIQFTAEVDGNRDEDWAFNTLSKMGTATLDNWNGKLATFSYGNGSSMIYPAEGTAATVTKSDKIPVYTAIIHVTAGKEFKMSVNSTGCKINVSEFSKNAFTAGTRVETVLSTNDVTIPSASVITYTEVSTLADAAKTAIEAKFGTGKYYYKGDAITFTTDADNTPLYLKATDGETTKATNASLQAHLNLGANVTGKVVPVLILSDSEGPAYDFIVD